ncbi:AAA family ATPase [Flavobacterium branchiarum]|uniref:AAA family ATPase n=1 Tax=Flavobacterium branchiarum TaxID=1114870 RepID=A0ABV5FIC9_9FLAO|nr:AAA family ATPase [Flavobacterium branchiarum]MDN3674106.1 AAA family ATPase [Flavobacterium branchiarum]
MLKINKLKTEILTNRSETIDDLYGFEFTFNQGLNIVAGENSRGKTTINSCIFYVLGMEELLGGHNSKALDKALKDSFIIKTENNVDSEEEKGISHEIKRSKVFIEIENKEGNVVSLERIIKGSDGDEKSSNITVYLSKLDDINSNIDKGVLYVNGQGNNDDSNGFYAWFSNFIGITLPEVVNSSRTSNYSLLYLQMIFSSVFIEQTKGWSDFVATMPFFGVTRPKEKVVEFVLGLDEINNSTKRDVFNQEKNRIIDNWNKTIKAFSYLEKQNNANITSVPENITTEKREIEKIYSNFQTGEEEIITYAEYIDIKLALISELENKPFVTIENNREETLIEYEENKNKYGELKKYISDFEGRLSIEKLQHQNINSQLNTIEKEIREHNNLIKVFNNNLFNNNNHAKCPTCTQSVDADILSSVSITIPQLSLEENKSFLVSQKKIIQTSLKSLSDTIDEKNTLLIYFRNSLRKQENIIKSLSRDLIADDRALSESEVVKKIQLQQEVENLKQFEVQLNDLKNNLIELANKYHNITLALDGLEKSDDEGILISFEENYKNLLFAFEYDSNQKYQISINRNEPFKYFPVYKRGKEDTNPQSIRINSSASDFVRNIWAYTLALRDNGVNHPGLIMFDEPGQHRTKLSSLQALFKKASQIKDKQTIIFTSIDKQLNEDEKIDLDELVEDLDNDSYHLINLGNDKVIKQLN